MNIKYVLLAACLLTTAFVSYKYIKSRNNKILEIWEDQERWVPDPNEKNWLFVLVLLTVCDVIFYLKSI